MWLWVFLVAAVVALALLAIAWVRGRRHPVPAPPLATHHPIVLVHGYGGFTRIGAGPLRGDYFRGVAAALERSGALVYRPRLPMIAGVARRARALADFIAALEHERVNVIAHSMGGLDARYAIAKLGVGNRVASLITIGTPHRGTPLAVLGASGPVRLVGLMARRLGLDIGGAAWLTPAAAARFNHEIADRDGIFYGSVIGHTPPGAPISRLLRREGPNDGLVPTSSQAWGEVIAEVEADHWAQIGWSKEYDAAALYRRLLDELRQRGL